LNDRRILLENIKVTEFFGAYNKNLKHLKSLYPKLKIVARGNEIKAFGETVILDEFEKRFQALVNYFNTYNKIDDKYDCFQNARTR